MNTNSNTYDMKHFEEWAVDKSPLIRILALSGTLAPEKCIEFLEWIKAGKSIRSEEIHLLSIQEWLNLYRNHNRVHNGIMNDLRNISDEVAGIINFYEMIRYSFGFLRHITNEELQKIIEELSPEERKESYDTTLNGFQGIENAIMMYLSDDGDTEFELNKETARKLRALIKKPEMLYFLRVWIPCYLLYGEYPPYLLRKARHGDDDALEKLLRLDKSVIGDEKIMELFHQAIFAKKRARFEMMTKAFNKKTKGKLTLQKIKYTIAGLISVASIAMKQNIGAAEIHRLFDAVARDTGKGDVDTDLIVSPETFEKAIQRGRTFWKGFPQPDKK